VISTGTSIVRTQWPVQNDMSKLLLRVPLKPHMWLRFIDEIDKQWRHSRKDQQNIFDFKL